MIPVSGSAYAYSYATLGEGVAWFIGWNLVLEYLFAASTVSVGWSRYLIKLLEEFNITRLRKSPSIALSGGERRRCEIARALASRPSFMLLDEPFAGIDPIAVGDIQELVRHLTERGIGVLITDHNVRETMSLSDRAYIIYDGQVLTQGKPAEIIANEDVRRVYLGDMFLNGR